MQEFVVKPEKEAFVYWFILKSIIGLIIILISLIFITWSISLADEELAQYPLMLILPILAIWLFIILNRFAKFKKTNYQFFTDKIIVESGGILSDYEQELILRNVTHVQLQRPWLEHKIFSTGSLHIQSAGSAGVEGFLAHVKESESLYQSMEELLKKNNFEFTEELIQEESPAKSGTILEVLGIFLAGLIGLQIVLPIFALGNIIIGLLVVTGYLAILTAVAVIRYKDLIRRKYRIYDGIVKYTEGFLNRNDAFIPAQNISDTTVHQGLIGRILNLYTVTVSCQGMGQEISFKNMRRGEEVSQNIDALLSRRKEAPEKKASTTVAKATYDTDFIATYKPSIARAVIGFLLLLPLLFLYVLITAWGQISVAIIPLLVFFGIISLISTIIRTAIVTYTIKPDGIQTKTEFITKRIVEFTVDKITGVVHKENPFDRMMNTGRILFWSIGNSADADYKYLKDARNILPNVLAKTGIHIVEAEEKVKPRFAIATWILANVFVMIGLLIVSTVASIVFTWASLILIFVAIGIFILIRTWQCSKMELAFHNEYVIYKKGIFFNTTYYVRYDDIKDVSIKRYPLTGRGTLHINVAGESADENRKNQTIISHGFTIPYIDEIITVRDFIDGKFGAVGGTEQSTKPAVANSIPVVIAIPLVAYVIVSSLSPILISLITGASVLLSIIIVLQIIFTRYELQQERVVKYSGVLYKKQKSIPFSRINNVSQNRGPLNKMFNNGSVSIHTTGSTMSSRAELTIRNIPDFKTFYNELQKRYEE